MSMSRVMDFLLTRPDGAKAHAIADDLGISVYTVSDAIGRLVKRNMVKPTAPHRNRLDAVWVRKFPVGHRLSFGGAEALAAMQAVTKAQLIAQSTARSADMSAMVRNSEAS